MALCEFTDKSGVAWQVWEVHPSLNERRILKMRRSTSRETVDRRLIDMPRFSLAKGFAQGWLAFRSSVERRRSAIPEHWEDLSNDGFCALLRDTQLSGKVRRLID
jgi:hypothetical protein